MSKIDFEGAAANCATAGPPSEQPVFGGTTNIARDLQTFRDSLNDAGSIGTGLWLSYLFVLFYFAVAAGGVTHQDLFFKAPVKLPFLSVDLPLLGFFILGPILILIVHAYLLLHLVLLSAKAGAFDNELRAQTRNEQDRRYLRRQLPINIFIQVLAGPCEVRTGFVGFMLRLVAHISVIAAPVLLLMFFQVQFLPYHGEAITWWHRVAVAVDMALLWALWPSIARGRPTQINKHFLFRQKSAPVLVASVAVILFAFTVATFPTETLDYLPSLRFVPWKDGTDAEWRLASLHELLFAGNVNLITRKPTSLWSNCLVLPGLDVAARAKAETEAKITSLAQTVSLRNRRLEGAVLIDARLTNVDFTAAHLQGASLSFARLDGASFVGAQLQGATLDGAEFEGASLFGAQLQGASFNGAQLQGAALGGAHLEGSALNGAALQGATLDGAQLQGASLDFVQLQSASLVEAQLQGAHLESAQLEGAILNGAQLQGAQLDNANLESASLRNVFVWRADARNAVHGGSPMVEAVTDAKEKCQIVSSDYICDWSASSTHKLEALITKEAPENEARQLLVERIDRQLNPKKPLDGEKEMATAWTALNSSSPTPDNFEKRLSQQWRATGCAANGAPYVIRGMIHILAGGDSPFGVQSSEPAAIAKAFLDKVQCTGSRGLSSEDSATLITLRDRWH